MKLVSTNHINKEDEKLAKKLGNFCNNPAGCEDLLTKTLNKIDITQEDMQKRSLLSSSSDTANRSANADSYAKSHLSNLKIYMPIAAILIILVGGVFIGNNGFWTNSNISNEGTGGPAPDGTVNTTVSALTTESNSELDIENQLQSDTQTSIDDVYNSTKSFGEISDEISL